MGWKALVTSLVLNIEYGKKQLVVKMDDRRKSSKIMKCSQKESAVAYKVRRLCVNVSIPL